MEKRVVLIALLCIALVMASANVFAYDVTKELSFDLTISGVYQYLSYNDAEGDDDSLGRGSIAPDISINFHPTKLDEFQVTFSFPAGDGLYNNLKPNSEFKLTPYADDLEDDVKNINERDRDYLLEAWYKHTFDLSNVYNGMSLAFTFGIIDSTVYLDQNEFANDEVTQFMNEAFVNNPLLNLPSYDSGAVGELSIGNFYVKALGMNSRIEEWDLNSNRDDRSYSYFGGELGYNLMTKFGPGHYRITGYETSEDFESMRGPAKEAEDLYGLGISIDQKIGDTYGVFFRYGWQNDDAKVDFDQMYSGGININGSLWGREDDEIGLGYAYLDGADDSDIDNTQVLEAYVKFKVGQYNYFTLDYQYMQDEYEDSAHRDDTEGSIFGARYAIEF